MHTAISVCIAALSDNASGMFPSLCRAAGRGWMCRAGRAALPRDGSRTRAGHGQGTGWARAGDGLGTGRAGHGRAWVPRVPPPAASAALEKELGIQTAKVTMERLALGL